MTSTTTGKARTRREGAEESRRKLLAAAVQAFSASPYDEVTAAQIAESAGVAHGLVFHHFKSKRGVFLEAMREAARQLHAAETQGNGTTPRERVRQLLVDHLDYMAERSDLALRLILVGHSGDPEVATIFDEERRGQIEWACQTLGLDANRPAVQLMMRAAAGAIDEATVSWLANSQPFPKDAMAEALLNVVAAAVEGISALDTAIDVKGARTALLP